ncbi:TPA: transposase family protein [Legionella pneumophila]|nr:transposase family protein [Legionella pneumophila]
MSKRIPVEQLVILHNQMGAHLPRDPGRKALVEEFSTIFGVTPSTVYRQLRKSVDFSHNKRKDFNQPRSLSSDDLLMYCRLIAALKIRTTNKNHRHLSTPKCIEILEDHGVETINGLVKAPTGLLKKSTVNRYLTQWGLAHDSMLSIEPVVVRFEAEESNDCWQFDFTPSDLKQLENNNGKKLFIASVTDDKSGVLYSEYIEASGEDTLTALKFLFRAMSVKQTPGFFFQGIPQIIYTDNGAFARSAIFKRVLACLGIELKTHMPRNSDGRRTTARSKGKVERTNRTVKESFETLFHFHQPISLNQANEWLMNYLCQYIEMPHRSEKSTRIQVWLKYLPGNGYRQMCPWERFCQFVREPETRLVGSDACVSIDGVAYQLIPDMAGNEVILLHGLLDNEVYVEFNEQKMGPFYPSSGPIPLNSWRKHPKTKTEKLADDIFCLAQSISVPLSVMAGKDAQTIEQLEKARAITKYQAFVPFEDEKNFLFVDKLEAKQAIARLLGKPLAELPPQQLAVINQIVEETLNKDQVESRVRQYFTLSLHQVLNKE